MGAVIELIPTRISGVLDSRVASLLELEISRGASIFPIAHMIMIPLISLY
jgi:hypothetical protein